MNTSLLKAVRAIGAEQLRRVTRLASFILVTAVISILGLLSWLAATYSEWWWIFVMPLFIVTAIIILILAVLWSVATLITPRLLTRDERREIHQFTDRLFAAAAAAQISRFTVAYLVIKDALQAKPFDHRLQMVLDEGASLTRSFVSIQRLF